MNRELLLKRGLVDNLDSCIKITQKISKFRRLSLEPEYVKNRQEGILSYVDNSTKEVATLLDVIKEQKEGFLKNANKLDKEGFKIDLFNIRDMWTKILKPNDLKRDEPIEFNTLNKVIKENKDEVNARILKSNESIYFNLEDKLKHQIKANDTIDKTIPDKPGKGLIQGFAKGLGRLAKAYWQVNLFFFSLIYVPFLTAIKEAFIGSTDGNEQKDEKSKVRGDDDWFYPHRDNDYECHIDPPSK